MSFTPTKEQEQAIKIVDRDIAVGAGAGSGKTKVLVERYLNLLDQGYRFQDIVAITFTKKAAQEMKERIRQTLQVKTDLTHLLEDLPNAQISTFHSFCQKIIA